MKEPGTVSVQLYYTMPSTKRNHPCLFFFPLFWLRNKFYLFNSSFSILYRKDIPLLWRTFNIFLLLQKQEFSGGLVVGLRLDDHNTILHRSGILLRNFFWWNSKKFIYYYKSKLLKSSIEKLTASSTDLLKSLTLLC